MEGTPGVGVGLFGNGLVMLFCRALIQSSAVKLDLLLDICWILQKDIVLMLRKFLQVFIMGTGHEFEAGRPHLLPAPIIKTRRDFLSIRTISFCNIQHIFSSKSNFTALN